MKEVLFAYREQPEFRQLMKWLKDQYRPPLPRYSPEGDEAAQWALIKYVHGQQDGFDLLYRQLTGDKE